MRDLLVLWVPASFDERYILHQPCFGTMEFVEQPHELRKHGSPFPCDVNCMPMPSRVKDSIKALNQLVGFKFDTIKQQPCRPPTKVQLDMISHVSATVHSNGGCPENVDGKTALANLTRSFTPYDGMPNHLADYCFEKVKILSSQVKPKELVELLPEHDRAFIKDFKHHVVRDPFKVREELAKDPNLMPAQPYWDPSLKKDSATRIRLFRRMYEIGLLDLQPTIYAKAGLFCVRKKTPEFVRLIVDARQANFQHRRPPVTRLGSSACLAELRLDSHTPNNNQTTAWAQEMDVSDCFYQFKLVEAAAWFGFDFPMRKADWIREGFEVKDVFDYDLGRYRPCPDSEKLYPCVAAMSMGWAWALYFAQSTVSNIVRFSAPNPQAEMQERLPVPQLTEYSTVTATYVDNVTIFGMSCEDVSERANKIDQSFRAIGIPVVWTQSTPTQRLETVGCEVDLIAGTVKNKSKRNWNVYLAGLELCRRPKIRGALLEIWLGHATSLFRLRPCLLSIFQHIYKFIELYRDTRGLLWPSVKKEIRLASQLVWLSQVNVRSQIISQVDAGDSADFGYAMMCTAVPSYEIKRILRFKEKWRYVPLPDDIKSAMDDDDKDRLIQILHDRLIHQRIWDPGKSPRQPGEDPLHVSLPQHRYGAGLDTDYGQWLQALLSEGDWIRTSAIQTQYRTAKRHRADLDLPALVPPIPEKFLKPEAYQLLWAKRWRDPSQHINLKEGLVALSSLKRTARVSSLTHCTKLTLSDNLPVVLAFEKGRSSAYGMNRLCRVACAFQVGLDIAWRLRHIESPRNVADAPSRLFQPKRPAHIRWIEMEPRKGRSVLRLEPHVSEPCKGSSQFNPPPGLQCKHSEDKKQSNLPQAPDQPRIRDATPLKSASCGSPKTSLPQPEDASCTQASIKQTKSFLEVFSGSNHLSEALKKKRWEIVGSLDVKHSVTHDLTRKSTQQALVQFILTSTLCYIHFGTPCTVFSIARKGLKNLERARHRERIACELAFFTVKLVEICLARGIYFSIENPCSSMLWELAPIKKLRLRDDTFEVDFPMCAYGAPYKKPTRVLTNSEALCSLNRTCNHRKHSQQLVGRVSVLDATGKKVSKNRTDLAGAYPHELASVWSSVIDRACPFEHVQKINRTAAKRLDTDLQQAFDSQKGSTQRHLPILETLTQDIPQFQQNILFGQDSAALKAQKKKRQAKAQIRFNQAWEKIRFPHQTSGCGCARAS